MDGFIIEDLLNKISKIKKISPGYTFSFAQDKVVDIKEKTGNQKCWWINEDNDETIDSICKIINEYIKYCENCKNYDSLYDIIRVINDLCQTHYFEKNNVEKLKLLKNKISEILNFFENKESQIKIDNLVKLIENYIDEYRKFPNLNIYETLEKIYKDIIILEESFIQEEMKVYAINIKKNISNFFSENPRPVYRNMMDIYSKEIYFGLVSLRVPKQINLSRNDVRLSI